MIAVSGDLSCSVSMFGTCSVLVRSTCSVNFVGVDNHCSIFQLIIFSYHQIPENKNQKNSYQIQRLSVHFYNWHELMIMKIPRVVGKQVIVHVKADAA